MLDRMCEQREVVPSAGIVDSQSVKAPGARERGYDAHKKISGRKRHIAVDTDGRLLAVNLTPADVADSTGAQLVLDAIVKRWPWVKHLFGDAAYDRRTLLDKAAYLDFTVKVVRGLPGPRRLSSATAALGRRAYVCMADAIPPPGPRLRATARCIRSHDLHRSRLIVIAEDAFPVSF
jgi:hypothetical protein